VLPQEVNGTKVINHLHLHQLLVIDTYPQYQKQAFQIHICIAMQIVSAGSAPLRPPAHLKERFAARFNNEDEFSSLVRSMRNFSSLSQPTFQQVHMQRIRVMRDFYHDYAAQGNLLCKDVAQVEDMTLRIFFAMLDEYQFEKWCPDISESPSSLYNSAHRTLAIDSFQQACMMGGYRSFGVIADYFNNMALLSKIYDSYVFVTIKEKSRKEARDPGSLIH
jgi:hypothetical protein